MGGNSRRSCLYNFYVVNKVSRLYVEAYASQPRRIEFLVSLLIITLVNLISVCHRRSHRDIYTRWISTRCQKISDLPRTIGLGGLLCFVSTRTSTCHTGLKGVIKILFFTINTYILYLHYKLQTRPTELFRSFR